MKLFIISLLCLLLPCFALAQKNFSKLLEEFTQVNYQLNTNEAQNQNAKLNTEILRGTKSWSLSSDLNYSNDFLEKPTSFQTTDVALTSFNFGLSRPFVFGGEFSWQNRFVDYDYTGWQSPFKPANHLYEYRHSLSYSQDLWQNFFGRHFKSQIDEANFNSQGIEKKTKGLNQQVLFNFYQHWLNAKVAKTLVILQKDALNRSLRRSKTIWKRVKDGISEKADWYDSQIELEQYKEELNLQKQRLVEALSLLSQDLHREVKQIEINHFNLESLPTKSNFKTDIEGNYSLQALQNNILAAQENVEQSQMELLPSLKFYLQYTANNIDKEVNETYTNAVPTAPSNEKAIGLKLVWNFENDATKAKISQNKITKRALEYERKQLKNNLEKQISFLKDELELVRAKISNALNKQRFAGKSLNSINRLYLLGRTDIDRLLRSEERLIQADKSMVGHLTEYKILKARYASFIGNLKNYLLEEEL